MANSSMVVHCGGKQVSREAVEAVAAPMGTDTHFPVKHSDMLETVEKTLADAGFGIVKQSFALSHDDQCFFGTMDLTSPVADGVCLALGIRNSNNKQFPQGMTAGSRVFVCDNLAFRSDIYVAKKHTRNGRARFDDGIRTAIAGLSQFADVEADRIKHYQACELSETEAAACILTAYEQDIVSSRLLPEAIAEWRKPSKDDFIPRTAWSLFNGFTWVLKQRQKKPAEFIAKTMKLYGLVDKFSRYEVKTSVV